MKQELTLEEREFLRVYHRQVYHRFRDLVRYVRLLEKLTKQ
ncbi:MULTISPECIES: hypothetical protein [unclassified Streptococcus]|nr:MULTISPECIES: hypothetical protein [unclassified Streptococcus]